MHIPRIDDYLRILTDDEVKDIVAKHFSEYFKSAQGELYSKLNEEKILRKVAKSLCTFLRTPVEVEKCNQILLIIVYIDIKS